MINEDLTSVTKVTRGAGGKDGHLIQSQCALCFLLLDLFLNRVQDWGES